MPPPKLLKIKVCRIRNEAKVREGIERAERELATAEQSDNCTKEGQERHAEQVGYQNGGDSDGDIVYSNDNDNIVGEGLQVAPWLSHSCSPERSPT